MKGPRWNKSEIDQLVYLLALNPTPKRSVIAGRLGRTLRAVDEQIEGLRKRGLVAPSRQAVRAALTDAQRAVVALYRRKGLPAGDGLRAALEVRV